MATDGNRIDVTLNSATPGLWPFVVAGYPSVPASIELITQISALPIRGIEIGFPFSDPVADGPVIQKGFNHALSQSIRVSDCFSLIEQVRHVSDVPLLGMVSCSILFRTGIEQFIESAAKAGLDGLIVPDVPAEEAGELSSCCCENDLRFPMLVAPTTPAERIGKIAELASGFLYYVSVQGTTGERQTLPTHLERDVRQVRELSKLPVLIGFGISTRDQVREVCGFANGAIVGSAIVNQIGIELARGAPETQMVNSTIAFVRSLF